MARVRIGIALGVDENRGDALTFAFASAEVRSNIPVILVGCSVDGVSGDETRWGQLPSAKRSRFAFWCDATEYKCGQCLFDDDLLR